MWDVQSGPKTVIMRPTTFPIVPPFVKRAIYASTLQSAANRTQTPHLSRW